MATPCAASSAKSGGPPPWYDVDAMSRLIDNEQGGMPSKPFGKHYLLLITA